MNLTIQIDNKMFEKLCNKEIENLPKEAIHEILLQGFKEVLKTEGSKLFISENGYSYGNKYPSEFLKEIVQKLDVNDFVKDYTKIIAEELEQNYKTYLDKAIIDYFMSVMCINNYDFQQRLSSITQMKINERLNRG